MGGERLDRGRRGPLVYDLEATGDRVDHELHVFQFVPQGMQRVPSVSLSARADTVSYFPTSRHVVEEFMHELGRKRELESLSEVADIAAIDVFAEGEGDISDQRQYLLVAGSYLCGIRASGARIHGQFPKTVVREKALEGLGDAVEIGDGRLRMPDDIQGHK
jgi:hypothetical protein